MDIRAIDLLRAILQQGTIDVMEATCSERSRALVDLVTFAASESATEGARVVIKSIEERDVDSWDELWVLPEVGRVTLEAVQAWQAAGRAVLKCLKNTEQTETMRELCRQLTDICESSVASHSR